MATFKLSALPAYRVRGPVTDALHFPLGKVAAPPLTIQARTLDEIRTEVRSYAERIVGADPDATFTVSIDIARGDRKPNGFDAASRSGKLSTEDWITYRNQDGTVIAPRSAEAAACEADHV